MGAKINEVTNTDIELLIKSGYDICTYAFSYAEKIGKGNCEEIERPTQKAVSLLATSRALADLAARILARAANAEHASAYAEELKGRVKANER